MRIRGIFSIYSRPNNDRRPSSNPSRHPAIPTHLELRLIPPKRQGNASTSVEEYEIQAQA